MSVDATVEADGSQMLTSQTLPKNSKAIKVTVKPLGPSATQDDVYDHFTHSLGTLSKQTDAGWSVTASGTTKKAKRPKVKVGCTQKGNRIIYKVRAAKNGVPLRKVVGKRFMVGIQSPPDASTSVPVRVTFDPL